MTLREAGVVLIDCDHRTPPAVENGYPYIAIPQLKQGRLDLSSVRKISPEHYIDWTRKAKPQPYDVVLSRRCNPGETAYIPHELTCALGQNLVILRADGEKIYPPFLRWLVRGPHWWDQIGKYINVGAVFDSLKCADIPNFELPVPSLADQRAIACILGDLDDKIELNCQMNQTLEQMAQAIFKSWFVDFEPVRIRWGESSIHPHPLGDHKDRPYLTPEIMALFPDELVDSELGEIPKGWEVSAIGDEVTVCGGGTPSTTNPDFWNGDFAWVTPKDLSKQPDKVLIDSERTISAAGVNKISSGQLPIGTVLLSSRAPIGYLTLTMIPVSINQGFIAMICNKRLPNTYVLQWTTANLDAIKQRGSGTTFAEISKANFRQIRVLVPSEEVLTAFQAAVEPLYAEIAVKVRESRTLAILRDTLLPKLLSGELAANSIEYEEETAYV